MITYNSIVIDISMNPTFIHIYSKHWSITNECLRYEKVNRLGDDDEEEEKQKVSTLVFLVFRERERRNENIVYLYLTFLWINK